MVSLAEFNNRMKDFYDVHRILQTGNYSEPTLFRAVAETIARRNTELSDEHVIFSDQFIESEKRQTQWRAFLQRANLNQYLKFEKVMKLIKTKMEPIYKKLQE